MPKQGRFVGPAQSNAEDVNEDGEMSVREIHREGVGYEG